MRVVRFPLVYPYVQTQGSRVARTMLLGAFHHPLLPARSILALVDTGADVTAFHVEVATSMGLDVARFPTRGSRGVGGQARTYVVPVESTIEGRRFPADVRRPDSIPSSLALFGRDDVFEEFVFGFDQQAQELLVQPHP